MRHARNLRSMGKTVIGFDPGPRQRQALEEIGGEVVDNSDDAIERSDAVVIATPSDRHIDDLSNVIEANRPVLVEKPFAHSLAGLSAVLDIADQRGLLVMVGQNQRFHPAIERTREILENGELGQLLWARFQCSSYLPDWRPGTDYTNGYANDPISGGAIFDNIHEIDLAWHLIGPGEMISATARQTGSLDLKSEDSADMLLRHDSRVISSIHLDYVTRPKKRETEIAGTKGMISIDIPARNLLRWNEDGDLAEEHHWPGDNGETYLDEVNNFIQAAEGRAAPRCDARDAARLLAQVLKARQLAGLPSTDSPVQGDELK